jgi:hypothetical protein
MTAKTRRLRELIAGGDAARLYRRLCQRRLARHHRTPSDDGRAGAHRRRGGARGHFIKRALAEIVATGSYTGVSDAEFTALRKDIEDLIGLDAYYRIEAETVEKPS